MFVLYEVTFEKNDKGDVVGLKANGPWGHGQFKKIS
jgi:hypothetical protein